ncbi:MAG: 30S ribosomal protein S9 [Pseudonocardiaceae bacterium]
MTIPPVNVPPEITPSEDPRDAVTAPQIPQQQAEPAAPLSPVVPVISDRSAQTVGRRKEAVVRVRLVPGTGVFTLNGRSLEQYFPNKVHQQMVREPLLMVNKPEAYDVFGNLGGGGTSGQAGALRLAIARALIELNIDDRPALKKAGFLTRDSRVTERKKYGLKKARKAPQYSKR